MPHALDSSTDPTGGTERTANLLGALTVALGDRLPGTVDDAAMVTLRWTDGLSVDGLGRIVGLSQPGAVRLVDRLVAAGLVRRRPGADGRTRALHLTAKGRRRSESVLSRRAELLSGALDQLDPATAVAFERGVAAVLSHLTDDAATGDRICRLCDEAACGVPDDCPVELAIDGAAAGTTDAKIDRGSDR